MYERAWTLYQRNTFLTTLRVPGEFFSKENTEVDPQKFLVEHKKHMSDLKPDPVNRHGNVKPFIYKNLPESSHTFLRCETAHSLEKPYQETTFTKFYVTTKKLALPQNV